MKEELITLETAKLAKEKGFDLKFCHTGWHGDFGDLVGDNYPFLGTYSYLTSIHCNNKDEHQIQRPTQSLLQKWLRDIHGIHLTPTSISQESWQCHITKKGDVLGKNYIEDAYSYEEALEDGLKEALKLIP
jgi:hypothetical protein